MKDSFTINEIATMTMLSTRTIRNYIAAGLLCGDKSDGTWRFTAEQVEAFVQDKAVRPALKAKKNALVYDFLGMKPRELDRICVILDVALRDAPATSLFFAKKVSESQPETELRFSSDLVGTGTRVILTGSAGDVISMLNEYYESRGQVP